MGLVEAMRSVRSGCRVETLAFAALAAATGAIGFSMPLSRGLLLVSLVLLAVHQVKIRSWPGMPATGWLWLAFAAVALAATWHGVDPSLGLRKFHKLAWFVGIPLAATLVCTKARLAAVVGAFSVGTTALALIVLVRNPIQAAAATGSGAVPDFSTAIVHVAGMADAQRLMLGVVISLGLLIWIRRERRSHGWLAMAAVVLQAAALVITFKRGAWMAAVTMAALMLVMRAGWKHVAVLVFSVGAVCLLPAVQSRLAALGGEFSGGGRFLMWTRVAPKLMQEHPWGVGYMSLTNRMMRDVEPTVERNRNHLHSNAVQVAVETGFPGLAIYLLWMAGGLIDSAAFVWRAVSLQTGEAGLAVILLLAMGGLLLCGLVEYNFGDAELILPYGIVMGCAAAGRRRERAPANA